MPAGDLTRISGATRLVAILGHPVTHSLSPRMHNAAFSAAGLDYCYLAFDVLPKDIEAAMRGVRALGFAGLNITAPHKLTALPFLDELTEEARAIGAANTAANLDGHWIGTNTDATGFRKMLELNDLYRPGMKAVLLGAGGAARSALYALGKVASRVDVFNRTPERARSLIDSLEAYRGAGEWKLFPLEKGALSARLKDADLLVNTTTVGMHPNYAASPLPEGTVLPARCAVVDMIYHPPKTRLLTDAEAGGSRAFSGHQMLLYQAVDAFKFWTGVDPDVAVMDRALREAMNSTQS